MAWWGVIKHAPWGEIAKAASRVPDFVRELRKPSAPAEPIRPATSTPVPDAEQLKFEIELLKSNIDRLRTFSESQSAAMDAQAKALTASFDAILGPHPHPHLARGCRTGRQPDRTRHRAASLEPHSTQESPVEQPDRSPRSRHRRLQGHSRHRGAGEARRHAWRPEDSLVTLESDKATMDVPAPSAGVVKELKVKVGDKVSQGTLILMLEADGRAGRQAGQRRAPPPAPRRTGTASPPRRHRPPLAACVRWPRATSTPKWSCSAPAPAATPPRSAPPTSARRWC